MYDRISIRDGLPVVRYWTPDEYKTRNQKIVSVWSALKVNETVDVLNAALYAEALKMIEVLEDAKDVKCPHVYGLISS